MDVPLKERLIVNMQRTLTSHDWVKTLKVGELSIIKPHENFVFNFVKNSFLDSC